MGQWFSKCCFGRKKPAEPRQLMKQGSGEKKETHDFATQISEVESAIAESEKDLRKLEDEKIALEQQGEHLVQTNQETKLVELGMHIARLNKTIDGFKSRINILRNKRLELMTSANMHKFNAVITNANNPPLPAQTNYSPMNLGDMQKQFAKIEAQMASPIEESQVKDIISTMRSRASTNASNTKGPARYIDESTNLIAGQKPRTPKNTLLPPNPLLYAEINIQSTRGPELQDTNYLAVSCMPGTAESRKKIDERLGRALM
jgi:chaperonin cofactor prefoldin